jgi:ATP-dependent Lon protease
MIYSQFVSKTSKYLNSVRILQTYITFDMIFPTSWVMLKKLPEGVEILQNNDKEGRLITSFVCENINSLIDGVEMCIDKIVKTNIEREEKERLFKLKVQELKSIFETENLENLKGLKFDVEELNNLLQNEPEEDNTGVTEGAKSA